MPSGDTLATYYPGGARCTFSWATPFNLGCVTGINGFSAEVFEPERDRPAPPVAAYIEAARTGCPPFAEPSAIADNGDAIARTTLYRPIDENRILDLDVRGSYDSDCSVDTMFLQRLGDIAEPTLKALPRVA
jgi:hypothetical protein